MKNKIFFTTLASFLLFSSLAVSAKLSGSVTFPWEPKAASPIIAGALYPGDGKADEGQLPGMTVEQIMAQMQRVADKNYFSFKIEGRPVFESGRSEGSLRIENPSYNMYLLVTQIFLPDDEGGRGEMVYDSGGLRPDQHIDRDRLLTPLEKGEYRAIAAMSFYDPETELKIGEHEAELLITIQS